MIVYDPSWLVGSLEIFLQLPGSWILLVDRHYNICYKTLLDTFDMGILFETEHPTDILCHDGYNIGMKYALF